MSESKSATLINRLPSEAEFTHHADRGLQYLWGTFFRGRDFPIGLELLFRMQEKLIERGIRLSYYDKPTTTDNAGKPIKGHLEIGFHTPVTDVLEGQPILLTLGNGLATVEHFFDPRERHLMLTGRVNSYGTADLDITSPYSELLHHGLPNDTFSRSTPNYKLPMAIAGVNTFMQVASQ